MHFTLTFFFKEGVSDHALYQIHSSFRCWGVSCGEMLSCTAAKMHYCCCCWCCLWLTCADTCCVSLVLKHSVHAGVWVGLQGSFFFPSWNVVRHQREDRGVLFFLPGLCCQWRLGTKCSVRCLYTRMCPFSSHLKACSNMPNTGFNPLHSHCCDLDNRRNQLRERRQTEGKTSQNMEGIRMLLLGGSF